MCNNNRTITQVYKRDDHNYFNQPYKTERWELVPNVYERHLKPEVYRGLVIWKCTVPEGCRWRWLRVQLSKLNSKYNKLRNHLVNKAREWLHVWCFDMLKTIGSVRPHYKRIDIIQYDRIELDLPHFEQQLFKSQVAIELIFNKRCDTVIMGRKQILGYRDAVHNRYMQFQFPMDYESHTKWNNQPVELSGLKVKIVPWFDGVLLLPKEDD